MKEVLRKLAGKLEIKNADERKPIKTRQAVLHSEDFKALWDRIKHKTTYRVQFDNEALVENLHQVPSTTRRRSPRPACFWRKADLAIGKAGVEATETAVSAPIVIEESDIELPDLLTDLQDKTQLTRRSLVRILTESERLDDFKRNPQQFIDLAAEAINRTKRLAIVDGIKYQRIGDEDYYAQELFEQEELTGYLKNMLAVRTSRSTNTSSTIREQSEPSPKQLEKNEAVKVYAKLPGWFTIPTPLGPYNPDWAVLVEKDGTERLYFVVETKSSLFTDDLRDPRVRRSSAAQSTSKPSPSGRVRLRFIKATNLDDVLTA